MATNEFWRDASDRLTFSLDQAPVNSYGFLCVILSDVFGLSPHSTRVTNGFDIMFQDFARGEDIVGLEWDNWTGFTVVAQSKQSEPLVQEIGNWLLQNGWADKR